MSNKLLLRSFIVFCSATGIITVRGRVISVGCTPDDVRILSTRIYSGNNVNLYHIPARAVSEERVAVETFVVAINVMACILYVNCTVIYPIAVSL